MSRALSHELEAANSGTAGCLFHFMSTDKWSVKPAVANLFALLLSAQCQQHLAFRVHARTRIHTNTHSYLFELHIK